MEMKYVLAIKIIIATIIVLILKLVLNNYLTITISLNPLYLSMVGGTVFIIGFMLAGVVSDYKESEKLPGEIASSVENIFEEAKYVAVMNKRFDLDKMRVNLMHLVSEIKSDVSGKKLKKQSIGRVSKITISLLEMEKLKVPIAYIARMKADRDNIRKCIMRMYHIKETSFVPAAYAILEILAAGIIFITLFVKIGSLLESILIPALITFFLLYMIVLIKDMDDPYDVGSYVVVETTLLDDVQKRLERAV